MEITVNEIDKVLDKALEDYKSGKVQNKNIIFIGHSGVGRGSRIEKWLETHHGEVAPYYLTPAVLVKEKDGVCVKDLKNGKLQYGFADSDMEGLLENGTICVCENLNYYTSEQVHPYEKIFSDRTYCIPVTGKEYDLHKLFLVIATAFPENFDYGVTDISNIKNCSDVYTVIPSIEEFKEYFITYTNTYAEDSSVSEEDYSVSEMEKLESFRKILYSPHFHFIFEKDEKFAPYSFIKLFNICETGNKDEILWQIEREGCDGKKTYEMFKKIVESEGIM